jgi:hypothetical protein
LELRVASNIQPLSIADFARAIRQRDPRLAKVPDDVLVRKVLERRPEMVNMIQRSEPRPFLGSLYERVGHRLKENLNLPKQAQGAASAISAGLKNIREGGPSQWPAFLAGLKQYGKPENAIGDVLTALILGQGAATPERGSMARSIPKTESFEDLVTRRGPGETPPRSLAEQQALVQNMRMRYERMRASGDPAMWNQAQRLHDAEDVLKSLEKAQWPANYQQAPKNVSSQGGGGANYTADALAEFKKKHGIQ